VPNLRRVGKDAEDRAASYLLSKGYSIVTRRFATRAGELDIVALDGDVLVFVEVKERRAPGFSPEEAVGETKIARWRAAAEDYLIRMGEAERVIRFDVIAIDASGLRHHQNALD
jgi:putative endonuclease